MKSKLKSDEIIAFEATAPYFKGAEKQRVATEEIGGWPSYVLKSILAVRGSPIIGCHRGRQERDGIP